MSVLVKRLCLCISSLGVSLLLLACGEQRAPSGLVYCSEGNPETFNPQLVTSGTTIDATSHQIYSRLVDYDAETGAIIPALATNWSMSEDGLTYHFTLRENVAFHQSKYFKPSRHFNADDVLFSFNRIIDSTSPYHKVSKTGYPFFQSIAFADQISSINKLNDYEIEFNLKQPDASFLANLATDFAVILSQEYADRLQQQNQMALLDTQAIGTGPYQLNQYVKNSHIRYKRNSNYWGKPAKNELLVFDITPNSTTRLAKLITGDCDVSALPKAGELSVIQEHPELTLATQPGLNVAFWALNTQKPPLNDVRVRKALAKAVDKQNIIRAVYQDTGIEANGILPPASWAYQSHDPINTYDPKRAKQLLEEAGVSDLTLDIWAIPVARIYNPNALKTAELIQADLANIGVKANIISYDWSVFTQKLTQSDYDSVLIGWNADNSDPDNFFTPLLSCSSLESKSNRSRWCNREFDKILKQARTSMEQRERKALYQEAEAILAEQVPLVSLAHAKRLALKRKSAKDTQVNPFGGISFAKMDIIDSTKAKH